MTISHSIKRIYFLLVFGVFFVTSCEEPVDLDIAIQNPQIVVNSTFTPGHPFRVSVSKSKNVLSSEPEEFVNNAKVSIFSIQGEQSDILQLKNSRTPFYQSKTIQPESGKVYRLEVEVPGYPQILAEDIIPLPVALQSIELDTIETFGAAEDLVYKIEVTVNFSDPIGAQDYYHLSLYNHLTERGGQTVPMDGFDENSVGGDKLAPLMPLESDKNNPSVTFHFEEGGVLFSDEDFDGQTTSLKFYSLLSLNNEAHQGKVVGELRTVSKPYYLFQTSLSRQIANKDRPFVEPVSVFTNIENGLGVFSGYAQYRDSVTISTSSY